MSSQNIAASPSGAIFVHEGGYREVSLKVTVHQNTDATLYALNTWIAVRGKPYERLLEEATFVTEPNTYAAQHERLAILNAAAGNAPNRRLLVTCNSKHLRQAANFLISHGSIK